jgi:hypothetical protein
MQERILDIELMHRPLPGCSEGEDHANRGWLDHWRKGLIEVDSRMLVEAANNPSCFPAFENAIVTELVPKYPFTVDDVGIGRPGHERPCVVPLKSIKLLLHRCMPCRITKRCTNARWHAGSFSVVATLA